MFNKNLYKYLITALLIAIPLYPKFPLFNVLGTYVSIRLEDFLIAICFLMFLPLILKEFKSLLNNKMVRAILIFLFVGLVSILSAILISKTVLPHIGLLHLIRRAEYLFLFVCGYLYIKKFFVTGDIEYFVKVLGLVIGYLFIYGLLQRYFSFPVIITQNNEYSKGIALRWVQGSHINSTFAGHYDLASYLVLTLPIFVTGFFVFKDRVTRLFFGTISLFGYWLFANALSRISIVSFMVAVGISLLLLKKYKEIIIFGIISIILFGFSSNLRNRYLQIFDVVKEKITSIGVVYAEEQVVFEDRSTSIRLNVEWPRALRALSKNPLLGTGYSSITLATDNDYLRALGEVGILGFSAFILIFISMTKILINDKMTSPNHIEKIFFTSLVGGTIGILISASFIDIFEASKFATNYWILMGILIGRIKTS
jgi:O-antigen ligase